MNPFFLQAVPELPKVIQNSSSDIQIVYLLGSIIVIGLITLTGFAVKYLIKDLDNKNGIIRYKDVEIKELTSMLAESDKANLIVLKDLLTIQQNDSEELKTVKRLLFETTNPNVIATHKEVQRISNKLIP